MSQTTPAAQTQDNQREQQERKWYVTLFPFTIPAGTSAEVRQKIESTFQFLIAHTKTPAIFDQDLDSTLLIFKNIQEAKEWQIQSIANCEDVMVFGHREDPLIQACDEFQMNSDVFDVLRAALNGQLYRDTETGEWSTPVKDKKQRTQLLKTVDNVLHASNATKSKTVKPTGPSKEMLELQKRVNACRGAYGLTEVTKVEE